MMGVVMLPRCIVNELSIFSESERGLRERGKARSNSAEDFIVISLAGADPGLPRCSNIG
jgi:hypothetical protein